MCNADLHALEATESAVRRIDVVDVTRLSHDDGSMLSNPLLENGRMGIGRFFTNDSVFFLQSNSR